MFTAFGPEATSFAISTSKEKRNADVSEWAKAFVEFLLGLARF
jgi:hypothetical protein